MSLSSASVSDLRFMLEDAGEVVVCGGISHFGIFDETATVAFNEANVEVQSRATTLLVESNRFPALAKLALLTVAGVQYQVREWAPEDDGYLTRVVIARTAS